MRRVQLYVAVAQANIICLGSDAFTSIFESILDSYRPILQQNDPLFIGDGERLGLLDLRRGRVHNLNETYFRGNLLVKYIVSCTLGKAFEIT